MLLLAGACAASQAESCRERAAALEHEQGRRLGDAAAAAQLALLRRQQARREAEAALDQLNREAAHVAHEVDSKRALAEVR